MPNHLPYSIEIEKYCLSCLLNNSEILPDVLPLVEAKDFYIEVHELIFEVIKSSFEEKKYVDKVIVADRLGNLGIKFHEDVSIIDYLEAICEIHKINAEQWVAYFQDLKKYSIARKLHSGAADVQKSLRKNINQPVKSLIADAERIFTNCVTSYVDEERPQALFGDVREYIESLGDSPSEDGIVPPFEQYYKKYGGFLIGDLYVFAAPPKAGKSTFIDHLAIHCAADPRNKCKSLILDTELERERVQRRRVAALSGVSEFYLRTGKWRLNAEMTKKVRDAFDLLEAYEDNVHHLYVANKPIDEIESIVRRWVANEIDDDVLPLICYDYLKLTGEKISEHWKEYQVIGNKTDRLKHLMPEVNASGIAMVQTNATGGIAMANQIKWFASNLYKLEPKDQDELAAHGSKFGTHKLSTIETRNQGEEADGFNRFVEITNDDGETDLIENYINFDFKNFFVSEKGSLSDYFKSKNGDNDGQLTAKDDPNDKANVKTQLL